MDGRVKPGHDELEVRWVPHGDLPKVELPTVMRKIVEHGIADEGPLFAVKPRLLKEFRSGKSRA